MEIVNWSFITNNCLNGIDHPEFIRDLIPKNFHPFKSLSKEIIKQKKGVTYLKCPAHTDFLKNTYVFCAPFDLTIDLEVNIDNDVIKVFCENISQQIFDSIVDTRFLTKVEKGKSTCPMLGIDWLTILTAKDCTMIEVFPAFMHRNDFIEKTTIIPGEYDISKWTRPIELVFEIRSNKEKIVIKKGDALSYIKFQNNDQIKLEKMNTPWEEIKICNDIRSNDPFRPLKDRYNELGKMRATNCPHLSN